MTTQTTIASDAEALSILNERFAGAPSEEIIAWAAAEFGSKLAMTCSFGGPSGMVLLDQIIPGSGAVTPIAGQLIARSYSRKEEYEADRHGAEILQRAGFSKDVMINTLTWLNETEGASGGGFFATHPATGDRIEALKRG